MGIFEATLPTGECVAYYWKLNQRLILTVSGATLLLAEYDTRKQASLRYAMFFTFGLLGPCFSGLLAYGFREIDGVQGKEGWRWIFILEGLITVVISFLVFWLVPDFPEKTTFLTATEKEHLLETLRLDKED